MNLIQVAFEALGAVSHEMEPSTIVGSLGAVATIVTAISTWVAARRRSQLLNPKAFQVPQAPDSSVIFSAKVDNLDHCLVGRTPLIHTLTKAAQAHPLIFIEGPSGVGKSTLLKLGVARQLVQTKAWLPVFVDMGGMPDWDRGPRRAVADALQVACEFGLEEAVKDKLGLRGAITEKSAFGILRCLREKCGRNPILIFDQLDDYQSLHWDKLHNEDKSNKSTQEVLEKNSFWSEISEAVQKGAIHCVCVLRSDAASLYHSLRLIEPKYYSIPPLAVADFRALAETFVNGNAVSSPDNGFRDLMDRVAADLHDNSLGGGILPIRMWVVLSGLASLKQRRLTVSSLDRAGGIQGLEGAFVHQCLEAAGGDTAKGLEMLLAMVDFGPDRSPKCVRKALDELIRTWAGNRAELEQYLLRLESERIVRRLENQSWQLYHDYVAVAVLNYAERNQRWQVDLSRKYRIFESARGFRRFRTLLSPLDLVRLLWRRARGHVVLAPHSRFVALSALRLLVNIWVIFAGMVGFLVHGYGQRQQGIQLASRFDDSAWVSASEAAALWELRRASPDIRQAAIGEFLRSGTGAKRFLGHHQYLRRALYGFDAVLRDRLTADIVRERCYMGRPTDWDVVSACAVLIYDRGDTGKEVTDFLASALDLPESSRGIAWLAWLAGRVGKPLAEKAARRAIDDAISLRDEDRQEDSLMALANLATGVDPSVIRKALETYVERIERAEREKNITYLFTTPRLAEETAGRIVQGLDEQESYSLAILIAHANESEHLTRLMEALAARLSPEHASALEAKLSDGSASGATSTMRAHLLRRSNGDFGKQKATHWVRRRLDLLVASKRTRPKRPRFGPSSMEAVALADLVSVVRPLLDEDTIRLAADELTEAYTLECAATPMTVTCDPIIAAILVSKGHANAQLLRSALRRILSAMDGEQMFAWELAIRSDDLRPLSI